MDWMGGVIRFVSCELDAILSGCHKVKKLQTGWVVGGPHPVCKFVNRIRVSSGSHFFNFFFKLHCDRLVRSINVLESKKESLLLLCLLLIPISNPNPILNEESLLSPAALHQFIGFHKTKLIGK